MIQSTLARLGAMVSAAALVTACGTVDSLHSAVDSATDAAVHGMTGTRHTGGPPPSSGGGGAPPPMALHGYSMALFQALFYQGGYDLATEGFDPGEYVQWQASGVGDGDWLEKALLRRRDDGSEWWRVASHSGDGTIIMEALFAPAGSDGSRQIRRMRVKWPDKEPQEVPITEEESSRWVLHGQRTLTEESYAGLKVGVEDVSVPAGSFTTDHLRTGHPGRGGTVHWWVSEQIPGGVVKFRWEGEDDKQILALKDFGDGATESKLGVF